MVAYEHYWLHENNKAEVEEILGRYEADTKHVEWLDGIFLRIDRDSAFFLALARRKDLQLVRMLTLDAQHRP